MKMVRVSVMIPEDRVEELKQTASNWREQERQKIDGQFGDVAGHFAPGGDAREISRIAREHFGGYREMFVAHKWPERGSEMMRKVQSRVRDAYGSIAEFARQYPPTQ